MKKFLTTLALTALLATPALALDLHDARTQGVLGEQMDGYVAVLKPSPEAQTLAQDVNAKRKQEYARISGENGQPVAVVAKLAAEEIIKGLPAGASYQGADGAWKRR